MLTDADKGDGRPYFLWDDELTWNQLRAILNDPSHPQFAYYLGKTLREADYADVWKLVSIKLVCEHFVEAFPYLGRQRNYWIFLLRGWERLGLIPTAFPSKT